MSNKTYDVLKYVAMIAMPAFCAFYSALAPVWNWPDADKVLLTMTALNTLLGTLIGISSVQYNKSLSSQDVKSGE